MLTDTKNESYPGKCNILTGTHRIRILHCPDNIGGQPANLARVERELGLDSISVSYGSTDFGFADDRLVWENGTPVWLQELKRWQLFVKSLLYYDIIHYNCGKSILNWGSLQDDKNRFIASLKWLYANINMNIESRLMRLGRKKIFVTYQGSDARQVAYCKENFDISMFGETALDDDVLFTDAAKQRRIAVFNTFADRIFSVNPDILHVLPSHSKFLPYAHIDLRDWDFKGIRANNTDPVKIVHAPSNRQMKGTGYIEKAIEKLNGYEFDFEYRTIENLEQQEARGFYEKADIVIDQLLAGWYGGLAVEAMALGKVVVGYIRDDDLKFIPKAMKEQIPIERATPESIFDVLKRLLQQPKSALAKKGVDGRKYVERWHDPFEIAKFLKNNYEGKEDN